MESALPLSVPTPVRLKVGETWGNLQTFTLPDWSNLEKLSDLHSSWFIKPGETFRPSLFLIDQTWGNLQTFILPDWSNLEKPSIFLIDHSLIDQIFWKSQWLDQCEIVYFKCIHFFKLLSDTGCPTKHDNSRTTWKSSLFLEFICDI